MLIFYRCIPTFGGLVVFGFLLVYPNDTPCLLCNYFRLHLVSIRSGTTLYMSRKIKCLSLMNVLHKSNPRPEISFIFFSVMLRYIPACFH